jgi:hypothetical protein
MAALTRCWRGLMADDHKKPLPRPDGPYIVTEMLRPKKG